jgi:hypothetical protein
MTEDKLQCYYKSVKSDATHVAKSFLPMLKALLAICGVIIAGIIIIYLAYVVCDVVVPLTIPLLNGISPLFTQYNTYILALIGADIVVLFEVKDEVTRPGTNPKNSDAFWQVVLAMLSTGTVFGFNALITFITTSALHPEEFIGWSYMPLETGINLVVIIMSIFLVRAYIRCENREVPAIGQDAGDER